MVALLGDQTDHSVSLYNAAFKLKEQFDGYKPSEVWLNHTSFDVPRLITVLYGANSVNALPWHFQKEFDIATAKLVWRKRSPKSQHALLKFDISKKDERHDSLADCLYNLSALSVCMS